MIRIEKSKLTQALKDEIKEKCPDATHCDIASRICPSIGLYKANTTTKRPELLNYCVCKNSIGRWELKEMQPSNFKVEDFLINGGVYNKK